MAKHADLIQETSIQSARDFEWIARQLSSGYVQGKHRSTRLGTGHEFQQYRAYVPGDDVRSIDWKMYAKTEKFYVKQAILETEHRFHFIVDNSKSMLYNEGGRSKLFLAKLLTSAIMRIAAVQGDYFTWNSAETKVPYGSGMRHWHHATRKLYELESSDIKPSNEAKVVNGSTVIWISDFYESVARIEESVHLVKNSKTELVVFRVMGEAEKKLDFKRNTTFVDLESGEKIDVDSASSRERYERKLGAHLREVKALFSEQGAFFHDLSMNQSITDSLRLFFHHLQYNLV